MKHYITFRKFDDERKIVGSPPVVVGADFDIIISSLGKSPEDCLKLAERIRDYLNYTDFQERNEL